MGLICRQYTYGDTHVTLMFVQIHVKDLAGSLIRTGGYKYKVVTPGEVVTLYIEIWLLSGGGLVQSMVYRPAHDLGAVG